MTTDDRHERTVLLCEPLTGAATAWIAERARVVACTPSSLAEEPALRDAQGLIVRTHAIVDNALLARAAHLRVIGRAGVGLDNIDLRACRARGIEVVHTPDANTQAVVEYVLLLLLDVTRPRVAVSAPADLETWHRWRRSATGERQLSEMQIGILGLGRIGRRVAEVALALGMQVVFNDLEPVAPPHGARAATAAEVFATSDVISIHIDGRPENRGFVGGDLIDRMRRNVIFINTSRGFVVSAPALARFLERSPDTVALLDVHDPEPITEAYPLLGLENARLHPHLASRTRAAIDAMSWVVRDVIAVLDGEGPVHPAAIAISG